MTLFEIGTLKAPARDHTADLTPADQRRAITTRGVPPDHPVADEIRGAMTILAIGIDPEMQEAIIGYLDQRLYHSVFAEMTDAECDACQVLPDIVIFDIDTLSDAWIEQLRQVKHRFRAPVIVVTGVRIDEDDRVAGLEAGADDYLIKPVGIRELLARIRTVARGSKCTAPDSCQDSDSVLWKFGIWAFDAQLRTATDRQGGMVRLSQPEGALLLAFLMAPGRSLTRTQLLDAMEIRHDFQDRTIDGRVLRLRRKLTHRAQPAEVIQTVPGIGYRFALPVIRP